MTCFPDAKDNDCKAHSVSRTKNIATRLSFPNDKYCKHGKGLCLHFAVIVMTYFPFPLINYH